MANITIQIPDAQMTNVVSAFTQMYGYQDTIPDPDPDPAKNGKPIPNPETKQQFTQRLIRNYIKDTVASHQGQQAQQQAAQTARDQIG